MLNIMRNRKLIVLINNGLLQGCVLSPVLFNIYTTSLHTQCFSKVQIFWLRSAGDSTLERSSNYLEGLLDQSSFSVFPPKYLERKIESFRAVSLMRYLGLISSTPTNAILALASDPSPSYRKPLLAVREILNAQIFNPFFFALIRNK